MQFIRDLFSSFFESNNWSLDTYYLILKDYGLLIVLSISSIVIGKLLLGRVWRKWSEVYESKGVSHIWSDFLSRNNSLVFIESWKSYLSDRSNKRYFFISLAICTTLLVMSAKLLAYISDRPGMMLIDPIMNFFPVKDWSLLIFGIEYSAIILMFFYVTDRPAYFLKCLWTASALFVLRCITILIVPLSPPNDIIFLVDPFTQIFFGDNVQVSNDLFFSGHVSLLALLYFLANNKYVKSYMLGSAVLVGIFIVWQHVHYSYDVMFAPIASYLVYRYVFVPNWDKGFIRKMDTYFETQV